MLQWAASSLETRGVDGNNAARRASAVEGKPLGLEAELYSDASTFLAKVISQHEQTQSDTIHVVEKANQALLAYY